MLAGGYGRYRQTCFEFQVEFYSLGVNKNFFFLPKRQFSECYALDCSFTVRLFSSTLSRLNVRNCIKGASSTRLLHSGFVFTMVRTVLMLCFISFALVLLSHVNMWCVLLIEKKKRLTCYELTHCQERLTTLDWTLWLYSKNPFLRCTDIHCLYFVVCVHFPFSMSN